MTRALQRTPARSENIRRSCTPDGFGIDGRGAHGPKDSFDGYSRFCERFVRRAKTFESGGCAAIHADVHKHLFDFIGRAAITQRSMDVKFHFGPIQGRDDSKCNKAALPPRKARPVPHSTPNNFSDQFVKIGSERPRILHRLVHVFVSQHFASKFKTVLELF
jgi:hypothetical protein